jgi:hypothetical protein
MGGWPLGLRARLLQPLYRAASTDSSRRHKDNPGDPIASMPSVAGSGVGAVRVAFAPSTLTSSGPFVLPAMIGLLGIVW